MNLALFLLFVGVAAFSILFGYNEGRRSCRHNPAEMQLRAAFEVMLVLETLEATGKLSSLTEAEKTTTAAMLAASKLAIFRKGYMENAKNHSSRAEKT